MERDFRLSSPAVARNREPILEVLRECLPAHGTVLELASGSGEHAVHFARALPALVWQPSDPSSQARASIADWREHTGLANLCSPLALDVTRTPWPLTAFEALVCINMLHISPWEATLALISQAGQRLPERGVLYLYGPFKRGGEHTASSNAAFDTDLRARDPRWGIRDLDAVVELAGQHGLALEAVVEMPANNLSVVLRRSA